jgi:hypothetical protein
MGPGFRAFFTRDPLVVDRLPTTRERGCEFSTHVPQLFLLDAPQFAPDRSAVLSRADDFVAWWAIRFAARAEPF